MTCSGCGGKEGPAVYLIWDREINGPYKLTLCIKCAEQMMERKTTTKMIKSEEVK